MPKSRKERRRNNVQNKRKAIGAVRYIFITAVLLLVFSTVIFVWKLNTVEKFIFLNKTEDGGAEVVVIDPRKENNVKIYIPFNTQISLSNNLGEYKIKNAWILSESENKDGQMVVRSIVKNFSIPLYLYRTNNSSNLNLFQKIKYNLIERRLTKTASISHDLRDTPVLTKKELLDGEEGYVVNGKIPPLILVNFIESGLGSSAPKVEIVDQSGDFSIADSLSLLLSTMGMKVSSYSKQKLSDTGCVVSGNDSNLIGSVSKVLGCNISVLDEGEIDMRIVVGSKFAKDY